MNFLVIDGNSILNRAFYGIKVLTTKDGRFTNAIYGTGADVENFECHPGNTPNLAKVTFAS